MWQCPKCKSRNLEVTVEMWAALIQPEEEPENFQTDTDAASCHDQEWTQDSHMHCRDCDHYATAEAFEVSTFAENQKCSECGGAGPLVACPDGAEICRACFDAGGH